ncbi:MAG: serine/threonine protein kinase [Pseudomonadota bacterium]|jgi:serine/threonine-protein kinase
MESQQSDPRVGVVLNGRYRITELLGEGGMGLVYRGERLQLGRPVAIKFLHSPYAKSPKYMARFEREARAMSKLSHPYCVSVIDFGVHDEPYIVMDFVTGETLRDLMDRVRIGPQRAIQLVRQILAGLSHAHGQGVIHRDIKPGNIMVGEATGVGDHVRIFDFGLAKLHDPAVEGDQSMATVIGTPAYMAPEQTRAESIDARADLYATGVLLFELLTGQKPFIGEDAYAVIRMQRETPAPLLRTRAEELSEELEQVVDKALAKDREQRYQTAAEFVAALDSTPESYQRMSSVPTDSSPPRDGRLITPRPKREVTATHSSPVDASASSPRSTRLALLGLLLVAVVGAFVYFNARAVDESVTTAALPETPAPTSATSRAPERARAAAPIEGALAAAAGGSPSSTEVTAPPGGEPIPLVPPIDAGALDGDEQATETEAFVTSDAGDEELVISELEIADHELNETAEREAAPVVNAQPAVKSISDVHKLIDKKKLDEAIFGIQALRKKSPDNPYLPYLLGDLYFGRGWWTDALAKYREAIKLNPGYRRRITIQKNAIEALGSDRSYARARVLLVRDVRQPALPALARAAQHDDNPVVRKRAKLIAAQIR